MTLALCQAPALDVHMLVSKDTPREWVKQAITSVNRAILAAPNPVKLHVVPGIPGEIGKARANGFSKGNAPYVLYVDDDDYIEQDTFRKIGQALLENPAVVWVKERLLQNGKFTRGGQYHIAVFKREYLIDHSVWQHASEQAQRHALRDLPSITIPEPLYTYRVYKSKARALRLAHPEELLRVSQL